MSQDRTVTLTIGSAATTLSTAASALVASTSAAASSHVSYTYNPIGIGGDIQWQVATLYYDATRKELQYMGKAASGQSINFNHYRYDEQANTWSAPNTNPIWTGTGHIWCSTFDFGTGDYYICPYADDFVHHYTRSSNTWSNTASDARIPSGNSYPAGALGWHPNLFGSGDGGLALLTVFYLMAWRKSTNTWSLWGTDASNAVSGIDLTGTSNGGSCYLPASDTLLLAMNHGGGTAPNTVISIPAGSGGNKGTPTNKGTPPIWIEGAGGTGGNGGKLIVDPSNAANALILETASPYRYWRSTNGGTSWTQVGNHPFSTTNMPNEVDLNQWTCGSIPTYGVVMGMSSGGWGAPIGNGSARLWKPG